MFLFKRNGYYHLQFFDEQSGINRRVSTRSKSKSDALKFLSEFKQKQKSKTLIKINDIPISKYRDEYLNHVTLSKSKSYITSVQLSFRQLLKYFGDLQLSKIDNRKADHFITETFSRSKYAANLYYRTLKAAFFKAVEWNYITSNPFTKIKVPKIPQTIPIFISMKEINLILSNTTRETMQNIFLFAFHTGLRLSEILNLKWQDINFNESLIKLAHSESFITKGKKERFIPMNETVRDMLCKKKGDSIYVFHKNSGCRYSADNVSRQFKKAVRKSGVNKKVHFHSLRHSFASNLVQRGVSLYAIKELLGHQSIATTQVYSHLRKQDLLNAVLILDKNPDLI